MQKGIAFLHYVADHPGTPYGTAATVVKAQGTQGMKIRKELENNGLISIGYGLPVRGKPPMYLWPTDEGLRRLGRTPRNDHSEEPWNPEENGNVPPPVAENVIDGGNPNCMHYWVLDGGDPPSGPKSIGECRECGAKREFSNRGHEY